jgi:hypothetical protein
MATKIVIPEQLKQELPPNAWGKILGATPIIMTVIATMLAGLASSEMTRAQYDRSLAAQLQSKAGDQWGYFQAKKLRSAVARNTLDLLAAASDLAPLEDTSLPALDAATSAALVRGQLPAATLAPLPAEVQTALDRLADARPEAEIASAVVKINPATLAQALAGAQDAARSFDTALKPINQTVDQLDETLMKGDRKFFRGFSAARLRFTAAHYDAEARLNLTVAGLYELQVRQDNYSAEKHHARSGRFFLGMLGAQMAVIISTFALAARKHSFLWSLAAAAGAAAVAFSVYVYLCV